MVRRRRSQRRVQRPDRHVENGLGDRVAIHFEGEPGDSRSYTYAELTDEVKNAANAFESLGVAKGAAWPCTCP